MRLRARTLIDRERERERERAELCFCAELTGGARSLGDAGVRSVRRA